MKKILIIHQDFPGQFIHIAKALVGKGYEVHALGVSRKELPGVVSHFYHPQRSSTPGIHPWIIDFESQVIRGHAISNEFMRLRDIGFNPDLVLVHPGWGEALFLKEVWPNAKFIIYCEFFYQSEGADVGFDSEFPPQEIDQVGKTNMKNLVNTLAFNIADAGLSPTTWQKSLFPEPFRSKIKVIHEGINSESLRPDPLAELRLKKSSNDEIVLKKGDEIITFVNRNLEPYRGYHIFMRALPKIMRERPNAHVLIIGGDGHSYGPKAPNNQTWRDIFLSEVVGELDMNRVHFLGQISHENFIKVLQVSAAHIYLTYPFVLSWSLLEAMSIGCPIIASNVDPVKEVIEDEKNGILINFFDHNQLAAKAIELLSLPEKGLRLGAKARDLIQEKYDLLKYSLPHQISWIESFLK
jgi:glycosyltransferase involved in cell wall biosynthesis